jgi:O-antigen/teichoic acid export membrane protein
VVVARLLGPRGYGVVAVAISSATVIATLSVVGAGDLAIRETAALSTRKAWDELRLFVGWSIRTVLKISVAAAALMAAASLLPTPYASALLLGSATVPLLALLQVLKGVVQGSGAVVRAQLPLDVVRWIITLALLAFLLLTKSPATPLAVLLIIVIGLSLALVTSAALLRRFLRSIPMAAGASLAANEWLFQSLPFLAIALFGIIGTEIGTLLLGLLSGPREAGLYQPIAKLAPLMMLGNGAIEAALAPRLASSWEANDVSTLQRLVRHSVVASAAVTSAICVAIVLASPYILRAFGPDFAKYGGLIIWLGVAQVLNAATGAAPLLLAMTGDMKRRIRAQVVTMVVQVGLGLAFIPSLGAVGAVISLVAAILVWSLLHWWLALRTTGIDTSLISVFASRKKAVAE